MASLAEQFRSTLVLCTATQPSLGDLLHTYAPSCPITELCPQTAEEYDSFRRVTFRQEGILEAVGTDYLVLRQGTFSTGCDLYALKFIEFHDDPPA